MSKFDFNTTAKQYDEYYNTETGQKIDTIEKRLVAKYLNKIPEKEALEIGAGTGHWSMFFSDHGFQITGIDLASEMLQKAIEKNVPGAIFMEMNAEHLMFPNEAVKNIFTIATVEFTNNKETFFDEAFRVLKRNGCFLIGALNENSLIGRTKEQDPVFKNADFFTEESLLRHLNRFGHATVEGCAVMTEEGKLLDFDDDQSLTQEQKNKEGAFLVGFVKKL
ncbi:MAG: methyltransferase domain-containing protein [Bacteroidales bacterium]